MTANLSAVPQRALQWGAIAALVFGGSALGAASTVGLMGRSSVDGAPRTVVLLPPPTSDGDELPVKSDELAMTEPTARGLAAVPSSARSSKETLALARLLLSDEVQQLDRLRERAKSNPTVGRQGGTQELLMNAARDEALALDALSVIASLPGPESADMLYEVWTGTPTRTRGTALAEQLLYSKDLLPKASPALRVALDLRRAERCEQVAALLPRATEHGDRRVVRLLGRVNRPKLACGSHRNQDCHSCVRNTPELLDAIQAAMRRPAPHFR